MRKEETGVDTKRRNFLKLASASVPAAAVSVTVGTQAEAVELPTEEGAYKTRHTLRHTLKAPGSKPDDFTKIRRGCVTPRPGREQISPNNRVNL